MPFEKALKIGIVVADKVQFQSSSFKCGPMWFQILKCTDGFGGILDMNNLAVDDTCCVHGNKV